MTSFLKDLAFHRTGEPRRWFAYVLFQDGLIVRPMFRRIVYKKSGAMRPNYAAWMRRAIRDEQITGSNGTTVVEQRQPEELFLEAMPKFEDGVVTHWRAGPSPERLLDHDDLSKLLASADDLTGRLMIAVSHDDYLTVPGGVQLCIQREQAKAAEKGVKYLQIHPWHPLPRLAHLEEETDLLIALNLDGQSIGFSRTSSLIKALRTVIPSLAQAEVVVHHLLGHLPEQVIELVKATGSDQCIFWLHDFFSMCPSFILQRNNLTFCAGPPPSSNACMVCTYGTERNTHTNRIQAFFNALSVKVASPSSVTAEFWLAKAKLKAQSVFVLPHTILDITSRVPQASSTGDRPITVGYLGAPAQHKGWPTYLNVLNQNSQNEDYRFVIMSKSQATVEQSTWIPVHVTSANSTAMSDAVANENVDLVLHWPSWPETFSFTTFEALAGSAYVITHRESGNVAAAVEETGRGIILNNEEDLHAFFRDGRARALADHRRKISSEFIIRPCHSDMSFELVMKD